MSAKHRVGRAAAKVEAAAQVDEERAPESAEVEAVGIAAAQAQVNTDTAEDAPTLMPKHQSIAARQLAEMDEDEEPVELLTRRSRRHDAQNDFDIPDEYKRPGYDYEWKTTRVNGADVDGSEMAKVHEQGWRPVRAKDMPRMVAPGYRGKTIERLGQILCMRPMHLTLEARAEDYEIAETQKQDKLQSASAVPTARPGLINPFVEKLEFVGEVGTHKPKGKSAAA